MGDQDELNALGVTGEWIWGNDLETIVFAQAYGLGKTLIFRFTIDSQASSSLATRIVNCYHDREVDGEFNTFPDRASMRSAIWTAVAKVWVECSSRPGIKDVDVIIDVYDFYLKDLPRTVWNHCHEKLFNDYVDHLSTLDQPSLKQSVANVEMKDLVRLEQLGGRGCSTLVYDSQQPNPKLRFKGIDFRTYLFGYESGLIEEDIKVYYRSLELLANMPPHPNIMPPPEPLVTINKFGEDKPFVSGSLYPFLPNGTLAERIQKNVESGQRIPLSRKAQWCYEMASALAHTHLVAHTYHMDIKPGNFLLDEDDKLVLIDWEQCDAPVTTAAPEIDGTWDVEELTEDGNSTLRYTEYSGPERRNMPLTTPGENGWNIWNVFLEWSKTCPKALELAEVFSLGRSMWMLLDQTDMERFEDVESTDDVLVNWNSSHDIPDSWKGVVQRCLKVDPNERLGLRELVAFWDQEIKGQR